MLIGENLNIIEDFTENCLSSMRAMDNQVHSMKCPHCKNPVQFPIVARIEDIENVKILLSVMRQYINNDPLYIASRINFIKDLQDLKDKYNK